MIKVLKQLGFYLSYTGETIAANVFNEENLPFNFITPYFAVGSLPIEKPDYNLSGFVEAVSGKIVQAYKDNIITVFKEQGYFDKGLLIVQAISETEAVHTVDWKQVANVETVYIGISDFSIESDNNTPVVVSTIEKTKQAIKAGKGIYVHCEAGTSRGPFIAALVISGVFDISFYEAREIIRFCCPKAKLKEVTAADKNYIDSEQALATKVFKARKSKTKSGQADTNKEKKNKKLKDIPSLTLATAQMKENEKKQLEKPSERSNILRITQLSQFNRLDLPVGAASCYITGKSYAVTLFQNIKILFEITLQNTAPGNNTDIAYTNKILLFIISLSKNKFLSLESLKRIYLPALYQKLQEYQAFTEDNEGNPKPDRKQHYQFFGHVRDVVKKLIEDLPERPKSLHINELKMVTYNNAIEVEMWQYIYKNLYTPLSTNIELGKDYQAFIAAYKYIDPKASPLIEDIDNKELETFANKGQATSKKLTSEKHLTQEIDNLIVIARIGFKAILYNPIWVDCINNNSYSPIFLKISKILVTIRQENANVAITPRGRLAYLDLKFQKIAELIQKLFDQLAPFKSPLEHILSAREELEKINESSIEDSITNLASAESTILFKINLNNYQEFVYLYDTICALHFICKKTQVAIEHTNTLLQLSPPTVNPTTTNTSIKTTSVLISSNSSLGSSPPNSFTTTSHETSMVVPSYATTSWERPISSSNITTTSSLTTTTHSMVNPGTISAAKFGTHTRSGGSERARQMTPTSKPRELNKNKLIGDNFQNDAVTFQSSAGKSKQETEESKIQNKGLNPNT